MIEEHSIGSATTDYVRKVWYLPSSSTRPERIGLFLDGEYYVNQMDAPSVIRDLEARGEIPPTACVFVSHVDGAARHVDLTCNPQYNEFLVGDVLPWIRKRHPELPEGGHLIAGPSLGGLGAAFAVLNHPGIFSRCLAHSGSFWWNRERLRARLDLCPPFQAKWWLSVGSKETQTGMSHPPSGLLQEVSQVAACEAFAQALQDLGHEVEHHIYDGGHQIEPWKEELPDALRWLA